MKSITYSIFALIFILILISSCIKEVIVPEYIHDTIYVEKKDTLIITETDTIYLSDIEYDSVQNSIKGNIVKILSGTYPILSGIELSWYDDELNKYVGDSKTYSNLQYYTERKCQYVDSILKIQNSIIFDYIAFREKENDNIHLGSYYYKNSNGDTIYDKSPVGICYSLDFRSAIDIKTRLLPTYYHYDSNSTHGISTYRFYMDILINNEIIVGFYCIMVVDEKNLIPLTLWIEDKHLDEITRAYRVIASYQFK